MALSVDPLSAPVTGTVTATFSGGAGVSGEWFGMHAAGATPTASNYVGWQWSVGGQSAPGSASSGSMDWPFNNPSLPAGNYCIVWWPASGSTPIAQSQVFALGDPPLPPAGDWVPMQPTAMEYVDLWVNGTGPRAALELYEPGKRRTPWIKNTTSVPVEVRVCLNGLGLASYNALLYWRKNDTDRPDLAGGPSVHGGARPDHDNASAPSEGGSEGNGTMRMIVWPDQSYRLGVFNGTLPEYIFETALA